MRTIQLADGRTILPEQLGFCTVHEHVVTTATTPGTRKDCIEFALSRLQNAYDAGVRTVVEVSPSKDPALLAEVVVRTPMQIVASTGFYTDKAGKYASYTVDDYLRHMLDDVEHGIGETGIIPGVLKIASDGERLTDSEVLALTAAGIAQKQTGLPLCVHSVCACHRQQAVIEKAGADLSRVYFCHMEANQGWEGRSFEEEMAILKGVLDKGSSLCFNNFNNWSHTPEDCMALLLRTLTAQGYAGQLFATMDFCWYYDENGGRHVLWEDICSDGDRRDYAYLITHVVPWLRKIGLSEDVIHAMNHENPERLFG